MQKLNQNRIVALYVLCTMVLLLCGCGNGTEAQVDNGPVTEWPSDNLMELKNIDVQKAADQTVVTYEFGVADMFFNAGHFRILLKDSTEPIVCYDGLDKCKILEQEYYEEGESLFLKLVCEGSHDITGTSIFDRSVSYYIQNDESLCLNKCLYFGRREGKPGQTVYIQDFNKETRKWDVVQEFFCETHSLEAHY